MLVWREYRGLTQAQPSGAIELRQSYIAMLEGGEQQGAGSKLRAIAQVLKVGVDDLLARWTRSPAADTSSVDGETNATMRRWIHEGRTAGSSSACRGRAGSAGTRRRGRSR